MAMIVVVVPWKPPPPLSSSHCTAAPYFLVYVQRSAQTAALMLTSALFSLPIKYSFAYKMCGCGHLSLVTIGPSGLVATLGFHCNCSELCDALKGEAPIDATGQLNLRRFVCCSFCTWMYTCHHGGGGTSSVGALSP